MRSEEPETSNDAPTIPMMANGRRDHAPRRRAVNPRTGRLYRIVRSARPFGPPPTATSDNLAIVPASLLPNKAEYQAIANQQAPGTILVVLPVGDTLPRRTLEQVATRMRAKGQLVRIVLRTQLGESTL